MTQNTRILTLQRTYNWDVSFWDVSSKSISYQLSVDEEIKLLAVLCIFSICRLCGGMVQHQKTWTWQPMFLLQRKEEFGHIVSNRMLIGCVFCLYYRLAGGDCTEYVIVCYWYSPSSNWLMSVLSSCLATVPGIENGVSGTAYLVEQMLDMHTQQADR